VHLRSRVIGPGTGATGSASGELARLVATCALDAARRATPAGRMGGLITNSGRDASDDREDQRPRGVRGYVVRRLPGHVRAGEHAVPWGKLTYDTSLGGYRTDITASKERLNARAMDGCFTLCAMTFLLGTVAI
jgi:hypothetical protein